MGTRSAGNLPAELEIGRRQFEQWRERRKLHTPIPEWLWARAVKLAGKYGVSFPQACGSQEIHTVGGGREFGAWRGGGRSASGPFPSR